MICPNFLSFHFYFKMQGIKSAKKIAKLERAFRTALQSKKKAFSYRIHKF